MTEAAANSVLKVFEEPPEHVLILATSDRPGMIPATVRSRMQQYFLRPISKQDVTAEDRSALLAAEGRIGLVQEWKASPDLLRQQQQYAEEFLQSLLGEQHPPITEAIEERLDVEAMVVRTLLFQQLGIRRPLPWTLSPEVVDRVQQRLPFATLVHALDAYHQRHIYFLTNVSPRNVYEDLHQRF
jgi:DNA polymerase III gamma/tau subunit